MADRDDGWTRLLRVDECPPGRGRFIRIGDHELAVFHLADPPQFVVTHNSCPHAGANLSAGQIDGSIVTCPWHNWAFDLATGCCTESERVRLRRYASEVRDEWVYARLGENTAIARDLF